LAGFHTPVSASLASSRQYSQKGIAALERGQATEAEDMLSKAVHACPTDQDARRYYAETLWLRNARAEAIVQMEEACRIGPEDTALRVRLAEMYLAAGRTELARQSIEKAVNENPKLAAAWAIRGRVMRAEGDLHQALADYQRALGFAPDDRQVMAEEADLYRQLHQPQRALETLQSLADTFSPGEEPQQVMYDEGLAYMALARYDEARQIFTAALERDRPNPELLCRLGEAQWLSGHEGEALATARQALDLDPQNPAGRQLLSRIDTAQRAGGAIRR
jgi:tetratricopeptide (TPR) repeat protein